MSQNKHIRNNAAEFLMFTKQSNRESIEVRYEDETIWLTQKLMCRFCRPLTFVKKFTNM